MYVNGKNELGWWATVAAIAAPIIADAVAGDDSGSAPPPSGGAPGMVPGAGYGNVPTTASPAFQQQFNPQFSPTMQQTQDSAGANMSATNVQASGAGQNAQGGASSPSPTGGLPNSPYANPVGAPQPWNVPEYEALINRRRSARENSTDYSLYIYGGAALFGLGVLYYLARD